MADKALLKVNDEFSEFNFDGKWRLIGDLHFKIENWSTEKHSDPKVIEGYGGWISLKNLPLSYWKRSSFEAIGEHFGGFGQYFFPNPFLDCTAARIEVKKNIAGFILVEIEATDGNI